ncbi:hypothetical protein LY76DRAFT_347912 [Colletotrichum caudatum]|nr:hypothetical protein LY76DRAFT_347912 [Colletotrichum caudatum]
MQAFALVPSRPSPDKQPPVVCRRDGGRRVPRHQTRHMAPIPPRQWLYSLHGAIPVRSSERRFTLGGGGTIPAVSSSLRRNARLRRAACNPPPPACQASLHSMVLAMDRLIGHAPVVRFSDHRAEHVSWQVSHGFRPSIEMGECVRHFRIARWPSWLAISLNGLMRPAAARQVYEYPLVNYDSVI